MTGGGAGWLITGMGAVTSVGRDVAELFGAVCDGRSGLGELKAFDRTRFRAGKAYEIDDRAVDGTDEPLRATRWLLTAVAEAVADAGLDPDLGETPVLVGSTLRELRSVELAWRDGADFDLARLHFGTALREEFGATGTYTMANACSASLYALGMAADLLDLGEADTVVVAGTDTISESTYGMLDRVYPLPPDAVRPFDRNRRGMLQGDGAAAIVLQRPGAATARAHARVRGVAVNCDARHPSAPDPASIARVIRQAHERAGVKPADIGLVLLHGTGTPLNDEAEAAALSEVFGADAAGPWMTAVKSMIGHTAGASGLHSLIVAVESLKAGRVPPITGLAEPIDEVSRFRLVREHAVPAAPVTAQVDSFGFGGLNAVAIVDREPR
ncbi:beta-ketoacyl synthase [Amycolatopsis sp. YIM 10]|uniref:beta-ketoacyl-[acyl-carrier-protein] synthase family protein n=1 Tax=Amycolatopsis sp. YIM 10 TaxID=2653857 RepID=UPI0012A7A193|nr:beta-ketoacyl synthase N-terminal-like domain-containing protein [Amycolatopsis sp. YIM 10]QFU90550.1 3-oxoacyl-[acyl-carrier-protein] synthase 2 [Amycolatopsis sp. YIM 10]